MRKVHASFPGNARRGLSLTIFHPADSPIASTKRARPRGHSGREQQYCWAAYTAHRQRTTLFVSTRETTTLEFWYPRRRRPYVLPAWRFTSLEHFSQSPGQRTATTAY